jgi:small subunit ribosomal protein S15
MISENPSWVPLNTEEVEKLVIKLAKDGLPAAKIGLVLRDEHAVPNVRLSTGKSVLEILEENDLSPEIPDDLQSLMRKALNVDVHVVENKKDYATKRSLQLIESRIRRLVKYYKRMGILPDNWTYSLSTAELQIE